MSSRGLVMKTKKLSESEKIWDKVFQCTPNQTPFLSYDWFSLLALHLQKKDPEVLVFWSEDVPVAIFPTMYENEKLTFIADERVTDICDMLYVSDYAKDIIEEFCSYVEVHGWHIDLFPLNGESPLFRYLPEIMNRVRTADADPSPFLLLPGSWEEYLAGLDGKQRHELRRKLRKAEQVTLKEVSVEQIGLLFDLMADSSEEKKEFLSEEMRNFFIAVAQVFSKRGWFRYKVAFSDGDKVGAILSFYHNRCVYLYNTGFDPAYAMLSPGIVSIALDIRSSIEAGDRCYDFLRGEERFKFDLGAQERFTKRIQC